MPKKFTKMKAQKIRRGTPRQHDQSTELFRRKSDEKKQKKERNQNFSFRFLWWTIQDSNSRYSLLYRVNVR